MNAMTNTNITLYITNTECSPMIALESLSLGIPCLVGPTSGLFDEDKFLNEMLTVNQVDNPIAISTAIERLIDNYDEVRRKLPDFIKNYNQKAISMRQELTRVIDLELEEQVFTHIYDTNFWTNGSGPGSHKDYTVEYRKLLQEYFNDPKFSSYVDLGCGDWQIMSLIDIPKTKTYKGYDIVRSVIDANRATYQQKNVQFYHSQDINKIEAGDLLIIKDVMIHWPNSKIMDFINHLLPKFKYALITNGYSSDETELNTDIEPGQFKYVDITKSPFNLQNTEMVLEYISSNQSIKRVHLYKNPKV
jgi:hypothetical protein